jgi:RNA recognition motif. (a.k.a. RRM, RBD, or RNP domain)
MPPMKAEVMDKIAGARDFYSLTKALLAMCEPFGPVHSLKLVHNRGAARVVCFIEMESPKEQPALVRALGAKVSDGAACLDIPVSEDFVHPSVATRSRPAAATQVTR